LITIEVHGSLRCPPFRILREGGLGHCTWRNKGEERKKKKGVRDKVMRRRNKRKRKRGPENGRNIGNHLSDCTSHFSEDCSCNVHSLNPCSTDCVTGTPFFLSLHGTWVVVLMSIYVEVTFSLFVELFSQSQASHCEGLCLVSGQFMWDLWRTKWHWLRFLSKYFSFRLFVSFSQCYMLVVIHCPLTPCNLSSWQSRYLKHFPLSVGCGRT
jgi:hypothetical protein